MARQTKEASEAAKAAIEQVKTSAPQSAAPDVKMAGPKSVVVFVRGPEDGRRRGGRSFGPVDVEIDLGEIAEADMRAILDDPLLSVRPKPADEGDATKQEAEGPS